MTHQEIQQQLPDFVLGLLAPGPAGEISNHLGDCPACRETVRDEREIGELVRQTVSAATRTDGAHLRGLMPAIPQRAPQPVWPAAHTARLAPVMALLLLIVGGLFLRTDDGQPPMAIFAAATATATSTNTPTATIVLDLATPADSGAPVAEVITAEPPTAPAPEAPVPEPGHFPTPVAALDNYSAN